VDERRYALVIGIDDYRNGIRPLRNAVRDAEAVAGRLEAEHGYAVELLRDAAATAAAITGALTGVAPELSQDSSFVLYYAGHGVPADELDGDGPQGFLLPQDADGERQETWLAMDSLRAALDGLPCRHLLLVLDCCYAGTIQWASTRDIGFVRRPLYRSQYERYRAGLAWHALTSAAYDEKADDAERFADDRGDSGGHSPFARALIEGLAGKADYARVGSVPDGVITATELYQYIRDEVVVNDRQTPGIFPLKRENKGEFVFLAPGAELNLRPDPPLDDANNPGPASARTRRAPPISSADATAPSRSFATASRPTGSSPSSAPRGAERRASSRPGCCPCSKAGRSSSRTWPRSPPHPRAVGGCW
jgi:hypothetical protein